MEAIEYKVDLDMFEGPLDLLLHLIKKNDLDIYNIPISFMLEKYNEYLDLMEELDVDVAGDFILMASELAHIKSRLLLNEQNDEEDEGPDPRADLVQKLLEYQRYKLASQEIYSRPVLGRDVFSRPEFKPDNLEPEEEMMDVEPFALIQAFNEILKKVPKGKTYEVNVQRISITDRIYQIVDKLKALDNITFEELFDDVRERPVLVITFLSILEMARLKMIRIFQMDRYATIRIQRQIDLNDHTLTGVEEI
ncbi:segregation/condensation protein A [bacterium]|nr:segregation/condensation protein A [bacterium]